MPCSSPQSEPLAGINLPDISARSLSYLMVGALISAAITKDSQVLFGSPGTVRHFVDLYYASDVEYESTCQQGLERSRDSPIHRTVEGFRRQRRLRLDGGLD
jgi:hypothetical protein